LEGLEHPPKAIYQVSNRLRKNYMAQRNLDNLHVLDKKSMPQMMLKRTILVARSRVELLVSSIRLQVVSNCLAI
jgi:hypothetical protein